MTGPDSRTHQFHGYNAGRSRHGPDGQDSKLSDFVNETNTVKKSSRGIGRKSKYIPTYLGSTELNTEELTCSQVDFLASLSQLPV